MKVFITGSTDLLGSSLLRSVPKGIKLSASYNVNTLVPNVDCEYYHVDITQPKLIEKVFKRCKPDVVIHTAAISSPDFCDKHKVLARKVNIEGTQNVINACQRYKSSFVFVSSNGIYDGENPPYDEYVRPKPIDTYGLTKYQGELITISSGLPFIIIRLMTMYGWNNPYERHNPATWLLKVLGKDKISVRVVTDLFNNFLFAEAAASAIWRALILKKFGESFNIAGKDCISRYEFSQKVATVFNLDKNMIYKATSDFFKNLVQRPKNTCFVTKKMQKVLGIKPISVREGLLTMQGRILDESSWKKL